MKSKGHRKSKARFGGFHRGHRQRLALLLLFSLVSKASAQYYDLWQSESGQRPYWSPTLRYIKTDVEAEQDTFSSTSNSSQQGYKRMYIAPSMGVEWDNYIYHPYLLTYSLLFEPGYIIRTDGPPGAMHRTDQFMLDGKYVANLLEVKPYASTVSYSRNYGEVSYDVFNSSLVDSQSWGATSGYREGPVPVSVSFQQSHDDATGFNQTSTTDQTTVDLRARNERLRDDLTELNYQYGKFDRSLDASGSTYSSENSNQHASLTDTEHFEKSMLRSSLLFYDLQSGNTSSSDVNATLNYNLDLTPHLQNYDNYSLSYYTGNGSETIQNYLLSGLHHRLYDSLNSGLEIHGTTLNNRYQGAGLDAVGAGTSGSLDYTKKLGGWGRLSVGNNLSYNWNDQQSSGGTQIIPNESYTVPPSGVFTLTQPREISVTSVTDTNNFPLIEGLDYNVLTTSDPWQIRILPLGPAHIQPGAIVLVTYTIQPNPSGSYSTVSDQAQISLRFWKERANVFVRYGFSDSQSSSSNFYLVSDREVQTGADLNWLDINLHGDYTDHRSTLNNFHGFNLSENYNMSVTPDSTVGIDLLQQWNTYSYSDQGSTNQMQSLTFYSFMVRYDWQPTRNLDINARVGYIKEQGLGFDEDLLAARVYLNWTIGKSEVHLGYEHLHQQITGQLSDRDFAFIRLRRNF